MEDLGAEGEAAEEEEEASPATARRTDDALPVGASIKARFQGGTKYCAGVVHAAHADGTYDVLYEDHVLEEGVPRDMIELVELNSSVAAALAEGGGEEGLISGVSEFFELFVSSLTSGATFAALSAERQAIASEKVRAMRPHFEAEFDALKERRGWGAVVTAPDIKELIPLAMARAKRAAA